MTVYYYDSNGDTKYAVAPSLVGVPVWFAGYSMADYYSDDSETDLTDAVKNNAFSLGNYSEYAEYTTSDNSPFSCVMPSKDATSISGTGVVLAVQGFCYNASSSGLPRFAINFYVLDADLNQLATDNCNLLASSVSFSYPLRALKLYATGDVESGYTFSAAVAVGASNLSSTQGSTLISYATKGAAQVTSTLTELLSDYDSVWFYKAEFNVNLGSNLYYKPYVLNLYFTTSYIDTSNDSNSVTDSSGDEVDSSSSGTLDESASGDDGSSSSSGSTSSSSTSVVGYDADSDGGYQGYYQSIYDYMAVAHPNTENWTSIRSADSSVGARTVTLTESNYSEYLETWQFNALPLRAYNLIYKEWFRDENLIDSPPINKDDGVDDGTDYKLLKRAKRHDYFTAALPWTQKGDMVDITAALSATGDNADIGLAISASDATGTASVGADTAGYRSFILRTDTFSQVAGSTPADDVFGLNPDPITEASATAPDGSVIVLAPSNTLYGTTQLQLTGDSIANILAQSVVTSFSINELREAFQIQRLLERDARSGTRYTEILRGHFGVISPDARLQRPEYLGGSTTMLNINTVAQTSSTDDTSPQGNLSAYGVMASKHNGFNKSFVEHGYIIGLVSIRADLTYQQGLHKLWTRQTRYDFYWPVLAHLGEQAVYNREIYFQNDQDVDEAVFGYQERWSEYRYFPSQITGMFRSSYKETLDFWHLSQYFEELPKLNQDFIEENVPIERVVAVTSEPHFLLDVWFRSRTTRPMPTYSVPGLIDHF